MEVAMRSERRAILALMAAGRISASEAERLLRAWNERFEGLWIATLCVLVCVAQLHWQISLDGFERFVHDMAREGLSAFTAAASLLKSGMGGTI
jgi:hypothetical protein